MDERDEIDRILGNERVIAPSADFTSRVMREVREEAERLQSEPLAFPWHRFLPGFLTATTLCLATFMVVGWAASAGVDLRISGRVLDAAASATGVGVLLAVVTVVGSGLIAWLLARPAPRRPLGL